MSSAFLHSLGRVWRAPVVQALWIQLCVFPLTVLLTFLLARSFGPLTAPAVAAIQGTLAMGLSWRRGQASWWRPLQFALPLALVIGTDAAVPPAVFLFAFLGLLLVYWSTYRTQVPYYPSSLAVWQTVLAELPERPLRIVDIGSGLGGFSLYMAAQRPDCEVWGVELAPLPWLVGAVRARLSGSRARMVRGDYEQLDFAQFDVIFAYLSPAAMPALFSKAHAEMGKGAQLFSFEFAVPDHPANTLHAVGEKKDLLHQWKF